MQLKSVMSSQLEVSRSVSLSSFGILFEEGQEVDVDVGLDEVEEVIEDEEDAEVDELESELVIDVTSFVAVSSSVSSSASVDGLVDSCAASDLSDDADEPVRMTSWLTSTPTVIPAAMRIVSRATPSHIHIFRLLAFCTVACADLLVLVRVSVLPPCVAGTAALPACDIVGY